MDKTKLVKFLKGLLKVTIFISLAALAIVALFIYVVLAVIGSYTPGGGMLGYGDSYFSRWWYWRRIWE